MSVADARGNFSNTDLSETDLRGTKLEGAVLRYAELAKAKLDGANLLKADLTHASYNPQQLHNARATGVVGRSKLEVMKKQRRAWWQFWG
jgi:uncharacterized protein YjbI with pentapeptide repeats